MLSIGRSTRHATPVTSGGWADLLRAEDRHVETQGFGAGVLLVHYATELLGVIDDDDRNLSEAAILAVIDRHLGWTDRTAMVGAGRLGVVVVPVDDALALGRRARDLHRDLRGCGVAVDVAYSIRRRSGGLIAAAARADAALDGALARRSRRL